jgi:hypothetical protein
LAILLAITLATCNLAFAGYLAVQSGKIINGIGFHAGAALAEAFGLWVQSRAARYIGGAW